MSRLVKKVIKFNFWGGGGFGRASRGVAALIFPGHKMTSQLELQICSGIKLNGTGPIPVSMWCPASFVLINNSNNSCSNSGGDKVTGRSSIKVCQGREIFPAGFPPEVTCVPEPHQGRRASANFITQGVRVVPVTNHFLS